MTLSVLERLSRFLGVSRDVLVLSITRRTSCKSLYYLRPWFDESLIDILVKHVPINVGVKKDYQYGFFNLVPNRRLFLISSLAVPNDKQEFLISFMYYFLFTCHLLDI